MELRAEDLDAYVRLVAPDRPEALERLRGEVERGERKLADARVALDESGELRAALRLASSGPTLVVLAGPFGDDGSAAGLLPEAGA